MNNKHVFIFTVIVLFAQSMWAAEDFSKAAAFAAQLGKELADLRQIEVDAFELADSISSQQLMLIKNRQDEKRKAKESGRSVLFEGDAVAMRIKDLRKQYDKAERDALYIKDCADKKEAQFYFAIKKRDALTVVVSGKRKRA